MGCEACYSVLEENACTRPLIVPTKRRLLWKVMQEVEESIGTLIEAFLVHLPSWS